VEELQPHHEVCAFSEVSQVQLHLPPAQFSYLLILLVIGRVYLLEGTLLPMADQDDLEQGTLLARVEHALDGSI